MRLGFAAIVICFSFITFTRLYSAQLNKTNSPSENSLGNFYQSVADYFKASQKEIRFIKEAKLPDEEIPVVYFISRTAGAKVEEIVNVRLCDLQWAEVAKYYGLNTKMFYDRMSNSGCNKHDFKDLSAKNKKKKYAGKLRDKELINLVNVIFISENNLCSTQYILKLLKQGNDFVNINQQVILEHRTHLEEQKAKNRRIESLAGTQGIN